MRWLRSVEAAVENDWARVFLFYSYSSVGAESEQPPAQQQAQDDALHPGQGSHLVLSEVKLVLDPIEGVQVCVQQSLDWSPDHKAITLPVHEVK